jgi:hypothetical protein
MHIYTYVCIPGTYTAVFCIGFGLTGINLEEEEAGMGLILGKTC